MRDDLTLPFNTGLTIASVDNAVGGTVSLVRQRRRGVHADGQLQRPGLVRLRGDDGPHTSDPATVTFNVTSVNDTPVAVGWIARRLMKAGTNHDFDRGALSVLANDTDVDADPDTLSAILVSE